jgi:hypothetical protein
MVGRVVVSLLVALRVFVLTTVLVTVISTPGVESQTGAGASRSSWPSSTG